jgi:type IV pilus assembly protein PilV
MNFKTDDGGFTLIEILIALSIFSFGLLAIAQMQIVAIQGNSFAKEGIRAVCCLQDLAEQLMRLPLSDPILKAGDYRDVPEKGFTRDWNIVDVDMDADGETDYKQVTVTITWSHLGRPRQLQAVTMMR